MALLQSLCTIIKRCLFQRTTLKTFSGDHCVPKSLRRTSLRPTTQCVPRQNEWHCQSPITKATLKLYATLFQAYKTKIRDRMVNFMLWILTFTVTETKPIRDMCKWSIVKWNYNMTIIDREVARKISIWLARWLDVMNSYNYSIRIIKDRVCHHGSAALSISSASNL